MAVQKMSHNSNNQSSSFAGFTFTSLARTFAHPQFYKCYTSVTSSLIFTTFTLASFLFLLPLCSLILYVGIKQWQKQRQTCRAKAVNHSDFINNIVAMEPIGLLGCSFYCCGIFTVKTEMMEVGIYTLFLVYLGRLLLQCLTCVEQYLAVIHPVTYLRMKTGRGIMVRNASIACAWLICLLVLVFSILFSASLPITPFFAFFAIGLLVIFYCSLSVLLALFRPGPGDVVGEKRGSTNPRRGHFSISCSSQ
ncbi:uncharacterized protein LOC117807007 isoform X3 [Notolabrus celidotus]|uniref:uncharacterized protein LOC117807007 isoform X3 n=1 Tax=Notolabrus celidotus TaxID=1203425 RepID=UPI00148F4C18|nr:uncharacterized protein LOC117807007 isoform X3 [Notolabrus celidotus]XP_034531928.1 uncharacterized protein LOC117807007 isoform X3 [Notolabrus celidotus]